jgi:hypothetical protein
MSYAKNCELQTAIGDRRGQSALKMAGLREGA